MIRLRLSFTSFIYLFSLLAMGITFSYTTQEYMDSLFASTPNEIERQEGQQDEEDDSCPRPSLLEEELIENHSSEYIVVPVRLTSSIFFNHLNLVAQNFTKELLRPPSA